MKVGVPRCTPCVLSVKTSEVSSGGQEYFDSGGPPSLNIQQIFVPGVEVHAFSLAFGWLRQSKFKVILAYTVSSRPVRTTGHPVST